MLLSKSCEYGIRASIYLTLLQEGEGYVSIRKVSEELDISFHFLTKIFQKLTLAGLLVSLKGPNGGVKLTRSPEQVSMYDLVLAIDGPDLFTFCMLGLPGCGEAQPCPIHGAWAHQRSSLKSLFESTNLAELAADAKLLNVRLKAVV